ncbi:MAG: hypothetical protein H7A51_01610 [Akkermansiaceae bacterium]|nr:hypothetical protein [Akkermansiaceae bacterium]
MKTWLYVGSLAVVGVFLTAFAEENTNGEKPEYAWDDHHREDGVVTGGSPYVYGFITVPHHFLRQLDRSETDVDDDPFGGAGNQPSSNPATPTAIPTPCS